MKPKFKVGDKVRIVNYGALMWSVSPTNFKLLWTDKDGMNFYDWQPERVGKKDVVDTVSVNGQRPEYGLVKNGSWYNENQLEKIKTAQ